MHRTMSDVTKEVTRQREILLRKQQEALDADTEIANALAHLNFYGLARHIGPIDIEAVEADLRRVSSEDTVDA